MKSDSMEASAARARVLRGGQVALEHYTVNLAFWGLRMEHPGPAVAVPAV